jgi:hypothetical protein
MRLFPAFQEYVLFLMGHLRWRSQGGKHPGSYQNFIRAIEFSAGKNRDTVCSFYK